MKETGTQENFDTSALGRIFFTPYLSSAFVTLSRCGKINGTLLTAKQTKQGPR